MNCADMHLAELYLNVLCDSLEAALELCRRMERGIGMPKAPEGASEAFFNEFRQISRFPGSLQGLLQDLYFSKVDPIPYAEPSVYPDYEEIPGYVRNPFDDEGFFRHTPKHEGEGSFEHLRHTWLISLAQSYDYATVDRKYGRRCHTPPFVAKWAIETGIRQTDTQSRKDALLTRAFHRMHPEFFASLGLTPVYELDKEGSYADIQECLRLWNKKGPFDTGTLKDFSHSGLAWVSDDSHKPYTVNAIIGEILYEFHDERYLEFIDDKGLEALHAKIHSSAIDLRNVKLVFKGDDYFFGDGTFTGDLSDVDLPHVRLALSVGDDGVAVLTYENDYYEYSMPAPKGLEAGNRPNRDRNDIITSSGELRLRLNQEQKLILFYPRYEEMSGYTNHFCECSVTLVEE